MTEAQLWHFFDMDTDYKAIEQELSQFEKLKPVLPGAGVTPALRILRQQFVPCVVSFIISANNNIKRFSKTIAQIDFDHLDRYTEQDFVRFGCGYRAPYLVKSIAQLRTMDAVKLGALPNENLRKQLLTLSGVGPKVADCIMLFAFHRLDVAPVDTWIKRVQDKIPTHPYAGVAQQYLFYYLQHLHKGL